MILFLGGLCLPHGPLLKWILAIGVECLCGGKARLFSLFPLLAVDGLDIRVALDGIIVVNDHFMLLPVSLTRSEHDGACILKHWNQVRDHNGLGEQILCGAKKIRTLPLPGVLLIVIISAMGSPYRKMPVLKSFGNEIGMRCIENPRVVLVLDVAPSPCVSF